ncbi:MAG: hypothetical protein H6Q14_228 [Bacteroidetes bacterium]|jgi:hypothetical protein|nr:hypothetical protein [Bacteroidota bacterium]
MWQLKKLNRESVYMLDIYNIKDAIFEFAEYLICRKFVFSLFYNNYYV